MTDALYTRTGERRVRMWPRVQAGILAGITMQFICFVISLTVRSIAAAEADFPLRIDEGNAAMHHWSLGLSSALSLWVAIKVYRSATGALRYGNPPRITFANHYWPMMGPSVAAYLILGGGINVMARGVPVITPFYNIW